MEKEEKTKDKRQKTKEFMIPVRKLLTKRTVTQTLMGMILDTTIKTALLPFTNMDADNSNASTNGSMAAIAAPACVGAMESIRFNVSLWEVKFTNATACFVEPVAAPEAAGLTTPARTILTLAKFCATVKLLRSALANCDVTEDHACMVSNIRTKSRSSESITFFNEFFDGVYPHVGASLALIISGRTEEGEEE